MTHKQYLGRNWYLKENIDIYINHLNKDMDVSFFLRQMKVYHDFFFGVQSVSQNYCTIDPILEQLKLLSNGS